MNRPAQLALLAAVLLLSPLANAEIKPDPLFSSHMVLQRNMAVPIWGKAAANEKITLTFAGQTVKTTADKTGAWKVKLKPLKTSKTPQTMTLAGSNTIKLTDILVGEVWLASGQSNMALCLGSGLRPETPKATDCSQLRFQTRKNRPWVVVDETTRKQLSAVAFYFGNKLNCDLDIPIGLVVRAHSGSPIQSWISPETAAAMEKKLDLPTHWGDPANPKLVARDFNPHILPIAGMAMRGAIWYQGERDAKTDTSWEYQYLLPALVDEWRTLWAERAGCAKRNFPFYYVQVPVQTTSTVDEWPEIRDAMRRALDTIPNSGMAVFYDYGPGLHPRNKLPAGERLALWALAKDYGKKIVYSGPLLKSMTIKGNRAILEFDHIGGGLKNKSGKPDLDFFQIAGKDGVYHPALAQIVGKTVVVSAKLAPKPVHVRYLHRKAKPSPVVSLVNAEGLPASSFMTDNTKPKRTPRPEPKPKPKRKPRPKK